MKKIEVTVSLNLAGCKRTRTIEVDPEANEEEIEDAAREEMFQMIDWGWRELQPEADATKKRGRRP